MIELLEKCEMCPHRCGINRLDNQIGRCKSKDTVKIAKVSIHYYEEPCISGNKGSGTVFFSNCNLNCIYCQNFEISQEGLGKEFTIEELVEIFLNQQRNGVNNINLVTPTSYVIQIIEAIKIARKKGLKIPIIYNTNCYENVEIIKMLDGYIDIYLPDLKYGDNDLGVKYSGVKNYFEIATKALKEMCRQIKETEFSSDSIMKKGIIVRHLILPNNIENTKNVLNWIDNNLPKHVMVSVMAQYFPTYKAKNNDELNRKISKREFKIIEDYLFKLNIENGYIQGLEKNEEQYVPKWDI